MPNSGSLEAVRNHLIHNPAVSGMFYLVLETVAKQLKERGYTVIQSANVPACGTDEVYYLEHPDPMVDPFNMKIPEDLGTSDAQTYGDFLRAADAMQRVTDARCPDGPDTFNWAEAEQVTDFTAMKDVTVRVPPFVHRIFLRNIQSLRRPDHRVIKNPRTASHDEAKQRIIAQLRPNEPREG